MSGAIIGLVSGFVFLLVLMTLLLLRTEVPLVLKLLIVVLVPAFYWVQYVSLKQYAGWPVEDKLPSEFVLIAADVIEPNKQTGEEGIMYWWIRDSGDVSRPPRVYRLPYVNEVHEQAAGVLQQQRQGAQFVGQASGNPYSSANLGIRFQKISKATRHAKEKNQQKTPDQ